MAPRGFTVNFKNGTSRTFTYVEQAYQYTKAMFFKRENIANQILNESNPFNMKNLTSALNMTVTQEQMNKWNKVSEEVLYRFMLDSFD